MVVPVALGLIFVLLFTTFGSIRQALLVFVNIPFALIGGVFALVVTGEYLSVPASVGFIALLGIAVLNGVVLVSHFNQLRARGVPEDRIVVEGSMRRLRPVLMTASITAFGLIPLLFASGPGSEIQRPLAIVVIGGLVSSTVLTLILLPILYRRFGRRREGGAVTRRACVPDAGRWPRTPAGTVRLSQRADGPRARLHRVRRRGARADHTAAQRGRAGQRPRRRGAGAGILDSRMPRDCSPGSRQRSRVRASSIGSCR